VTSQSSMSSRIRQLGPNQLSVPAHTIVEYCVKQEAELSLG